MICDREDSATDDDSDEDLIRSLRFQRAPLNGAGTRQLCNSV